MLFDWCARDPKSLAECVILLREKIDLKVTTTMEEGLDVPRCEIDVRQSFVVEDAVREGRKLRFDSTKIIKVSQVFSDCDLQDVESSSSCPPSGSLSCSSSSPSAYSSGYTSTDTEGWVDQDIHLKSLLRRRKMNINAMKAQNYVHVTCYTYLYTCGPHTVLTR